MESTSDAADSGAVPPDKTSTEMEKEQQDTDGQNTRYIEFDTPLTPEVLNWLEISDPHGTALRKLRQLRSPQELPKWRKEAISWMCYFASGLASHAASSYSPAKEQLSAYWDIGSVPTLLGITLFTAGFAVAPMALASLSEVNGRKPVFLVTGILFVVCQICSGVTRSYLGMLLARFFSGVGSSTYSSMVGGVLSDIYPSNERNTPMALFSCSALFGIGTGALASGFTAEYTTWRWIFYSQAIVDGVLVATFLLLFSETRVTVLLRRRAQEFNALQEQLQKATGSAPRIRWKCQHDEQRDSLPQMIRTSLLRPFHLLLTEPVVFFFSLWAAFAWATLYVALGAVPLVFRSAYAFSLAQSNAVLAAMCVGAVLMTPISIYQARVLGRFASAALPPDVPEARLYCACVESALLPLGLFAFGWSARPDVHWIVPAIAIGVATMGIFAVYLAVFNYLSDAYGRYASSALAAQSFCRNGLGGVLTLVTRQMFAGMGYGAAGSCLGGVALALTLVPWVLVLWGEEIRRRSRFASAL